MSNQDKQKPVSKGLQYPMSSNAFHFSTPNLPAKGRLQSTTLSQRIGIPIYTSNPGNEAIRKQNTNIFSSSGFNSGKQTEAVRKPLLPPRLANTNNEFMLKMLGNGNPDLTRQVSQTPIQRGFDQTRQTQKIDYVEKRPIQKAQLMPQAQKKMPISAVGNNEASKHSAMPMKVIPAPIVPSGLATENYAK